VKDVAARMKEAGLDGVPLVVGGIIPPEDAQALQEAGVAAVYTPKDFDLNRIMADIVRIVEQNGAEQRDPPLTWGESSSA
jgi:ethylmalonyl-CoA mutase